MPSVPTVHFSASPSWQPQIATGVPLALLAPVASRQTGVPVVVGSAEGTVPVLLRARETVLPWASYCGVRVAS